MELCENSSGIEGAEYWSSHASPDVRSSLPDTDSLAAFLDHRRELSVIAGPRTAFHDRGNTFRIEFGESEWNWTDSTNNLNRKQGLSVVICTSGSYTWSEIPVFNSGSICIGTKEQLVAGIIITILVVSFALVLLIWAKRRYL